MNVSELARQLRIHPQKLLEILPEFGFDIGARAVKIDDRVAERIRKEWRRIKFVLGEKEKAEKEKEKEDAKEFRRQSGVVVKIPGKITVKDLALLLEMPLNVLILELMKSGILATQNEFLDHDTATILANDLGFKVEEGEEEEEEIVQTENLEKILKEKGDVRPPVIVIMGHVDHGKTKLLDAIRNTDVVSGESGGITQHIGAYQVSWVNPKSKEDRLITFIDTPGHEAFTVMRSRGAKVADIAILVVAADDGVKPQTVEAINIIKAAKLPAIVAINKIDKEGADIVRVKTELSQHGLNSDEWGGDIPMVEISAKDNVNIDKLLDTLLLVTDINDKSIRANVNRPAAGTVIEAHVDKGEGPVATVLIQAGILKTNDALVINNEIYGKVRAMKNYRGEKINEAGPSYPVRILGFKIAPRVGDVLDVSLKEKASFIDMKSKRVQYSGAEQVTSTTTEDDEAKKFLNVVVKADTLGSLEAIIGSLEKIKNDEAAVRVVGKGLGNIGSDDVATAETADAIIFGFNVIATPVAVEMIQENDINFQQYSIIYDLLNYVKEQLEKVLNPELITTEFGKFKISNIFRTEKKYMILGGRVFDGKLIKNIKVRIKRGKVKIGLGDISKLQMGQQSVKEVQEGTECGLQYDGKLKLEVGDILEGYSEEKKIKKLVIDK